MIQIADLIIADRIDEYGVKYTVDGTIPQEFISACDNVHTAMSRAKALSGHVVKRTIFTTSWEPSFDESM